MTNLSTTKAVTRPPDLLNLAFTLAEGCAVLGMILLACATANAFMAIVDGLPTPSAATKYVASVVAPAASITSLLLAGLAVAIGLLSEIWKDDTDTTLLAIAAGFVNLLAFLQFRTLSLVEPPVASTVDTLLLASQASSAGFTLLGGFWLYVRLCRRALPACRSQTQGCST